METIKELFKNITPEQIGLVVVVVIGVTKGITNKFNVISSLTKELITLLVSLCGFVYLLFPNNLYVVLAGAFIVIYFGASGIYSFIPQFVKNPEQVEGVQTPIYIDGEEVENEETIAVEVSE